MTSKTRLVRRELLQQITQNAEAIRYLENLGQDIVTTDERFTTLQAEVDAAEAAATIAQASATSALALAAVAGRLPVGAIFTTVDVTNPATVLGYGTWSQFGQGRVLVGVDVTDTDFDTVQETGGAKVRALP